MNPPLSTSGAPLPSHLTLSRDDVDRLLHDASSDSREMILEKVAGHYNAQYLSDSEQLIAEQIFRLLMQDISLRVRETLAARMKENEAIPRDIVLHLAQDVESVAVPVLSHSPVLSDADLVGIVEASREIEKLLAISNRSTVSTRVSEALVDTNYTPVMASLLSNRGANLSEQSLHKITDDHAHDPDILQGLIDHPSLPITVVERLVSQASDAVAESLRNRYQLNAATVKEDARKVREEFMLRLIEGELTDPEIAALVAQMAEDKSLTPSIVMTTLCRGQLEFFTVAMAEMAHVAIANTRRLLADRGEFGFRGLYKKSGLPESMVDAVRLLLHCVQDLTHDSAIPGTSSYANRLVARLVDVAGDQTIDHLPYFIALVRQNAHRT